MKPGCCIYGTDLTPEMRAIGIDEGSWAVTAGLLALVDCGGASPEQVRLGAVALTAQLLTLREAEEVGPGAMKLTLHGRPFVSALGLGRAVLVMTWQEWILANRHLGRLEVWIDLGHVQAQPAAEA